MSSVSPFSELLKLKVVLGAPFYGLNVCIPFKIYMLMFWPPSVDIRSWDIWGVLTSWGWNPLNGTDALIKNISESSLATSAMWGCSEKTAVNCPGKEPSPDTESACTLVLDFSASKTVREINVCCLNHTVCGIFVAAAWTKTFPEFAVGIRSEGSPCMGCSLLTWWLPLTSFWWLITFPFALLFNHVFVCAFFPPQPKVALLVDISFFWISFNTYHNFWAPDRFSVYVLNCHIQSFFFLFFLKR